MNTYTADVPMIHRVGSTVGLGRQLLVTFGPALVDIHPEGGVGDPTSYIMDGVTPRSEAAKTDLIEALRRHVNGESGLGTNAEPERCPKRIVSRHRIGRAGARREALIVTDLMEHITRVTLSYRGAISLGSIKLTGTTPDRLSGMGINLEHLLERHQLGDFTGQRNIAQASKSHDAMRCGYGIVLSEHEVWRRVRGGKSRLIATLSIETDIARATTDVEYVTEGLTLPIRAGEPGLQSSSDKAVV